MNTCDEHSPNVLLYLDRELRGQELEDFRTSSKLRGLWKAA
jgi:hypothetical protein